MLNGGQPAPMPASPDGSTPAAPGDIAVAQPDWITYTKPDCCGPIGRNGPIETEVFTRSGLSLPLSGGVFPHVLETGWTIEAGGNSLFFNTAGDAAWDLGLSVANSNNHGQHSDVTIPYTVITSTGPVTSTATIRELNRTYAALGFGREWFFDRPVPFLGSHQVCFGIDGTGRLGTAMVEFAEFTHTTRITAGGGAALHSDLEFPCGGATFIVGLRVEWAANYSEILQKENDATLMDLNVVFNLGVRW
jgi:hypothetical protein